MSSEVERWKHMRNGMLEAACDPGMAEPPAYHFSTYRVDWMFSVQSFKKGHSTLAAFPIAQSCACKF